MEHTLIIGAGSPIAAAAIELFSARKDKVSLVGRNRPVSDIVDADSNIRFYSFDLERVTDIPLLYKDIISTAALPVTRICFFQRFRGNGDDWQGEINVSLLATERFIEEFASDGAAAGMDRSIVIVSSPADSDIVLEQPLSYHVGKAGLSQMVKYFACKLGKMKIRVNGIKPAIVFKERAREFYEQNDELVSLFIETIPLGRMGLPADIGNAALFFCSEQSSYISGQLLSIDGGLSVHENASLARLAASLFNKKLIDQRWNKK